MFSEARAMAQWLRVLGDPLSGSIPVTYMAPCVHSKFQSQAIFSGQAKAEAGEFAMNLRSA